MRNGWANILFGLFLIGVAFLPDERPSDYYVDILLLLIGATDIVLGINQMRKAT